MLLCLGVGLGADALGSVRADMPGERANSCLSHDCCCLCSRPESPPEKTIPGMSCARMCVTGPDITGRPKRFAAWRCGHVNAGNLEGEPGLVLRHGIVIFGAITLRLQRRRLVKSSPGSRTRLVAARELGGQVGSIPALRWRRDQSGADGIVLVFPICLLLVYQVVLDERVHQVTGVESVYGLVLRLRGTVRAVGLPGRRRSASRSGARLGAGQPDVDATGTSGKCATGSGNG